MIWVDFKLVNFLLGQQSGFTKYPCFIYACDSRDRPQHYVKKEWSTREQLVPGARNVINEPLVDQGKILIPPKNTKLGLMKQFTKALDRDGRCFNYLCRAFPRLTIGKHQVGKPCHTHQQYARSLPKTRVFHEYKDAFPVLTHRAVS